MNKLKLGIEILAVLKKWQDNTRGPFNSMWYGYDSLLDELYQRGTKTTIKELKKVMKQLKEADKVELLPCYTEDFELCGSGYFLVEV